MDETLKIKGTYILTCHDKDGNFKWKDTVNNLVTNVGKAQIALLAGDATAVPFTYLALGTSATAVTAADTTLNAEIITGGLQRAVGAISRTTTSVTNDTLVISKTFTATASFNVEEVGVLTASSGGVLLSHALTTTKAMASGDILTVQYNLQIS